MRLDHGGTHIHLGMTMHAERIQAHEQCDEGEVLPMPLSAKQSRACSLSTTSSYLHRSTSVCHTESVHASAHLRSVVWSCISSVTCLYTAQSCTADNRSPAKLGTYLTCSD